MKKLVLLLAVATAAAFAQDSVVLDSTTVRLNDNSAVLEKIDQTPSEVNLLVPVPTTVKRCEPGYMRNETRANGAECGYDVITEPCYGRGYPGGYRGGYPGGYYPRGPRYNPPRGGYPYPGRHPRRGGVIVRVPAPVPACIPTTRRVPRVCTYQVCDRPYYETVTMTKKFKVTFENYKKDENFEFSLDEHGNVSLLPMMTSPGCTSLVVYGDKPNVTGAKISIKSGWFNRRCAQ